MGMFLNSIDSYEKYKTMAFSTYFVDKTSLLVELIPALFEEPRHICITRPRRFGKTVMANMIGSFFNAGIDSSDVFDRLEVAKDSVYQKHLNKHNVIQIDFSKVDDECKSYRTYIGDIKDLLREDLHAAYPNVAFRNKGAYL